MIYKLPISYEREHTNVSIHTNHKEGVTCTPLLLAKIIIIINHPLLITNYGEILIYVLLISLPGNTTRLSLGELSGCTYNCYTIFWKMETSY